LSPFAIFDPHSPTFDPFWLLLAGGLLTGLRRWRAAPQAPAAPVPFEVTCACGQVAAGLRRPEHQVLRCARCGAELFILPLSRLPPPRPPGERPGAPAETSPRRTALRIWLGPAAAVALTVLGLAVAYQFLIPARPTDRQSAVDSAPGAAPEDLDARLTAARAQLGRGNPRLALEELKRARAVGEHRLWPPARRLEWARLQRQAELLAELAAESVEEILEHAAGVQEREWQAEFARRYRSKAVVFDLEVRVGAGGRYEHDWLLRARDEAAHLELGDLELLRPLPLEPPQRVLFGARLASVRREPGRGFVVRLEPASGVLITDAEAAVACFLSPEDAEIRALLERQTEWAARDPVASLP
jgi:hypothetical protein